MFFSPIQTLLMASLFLLSSLQLVFAQEVKIQMEDVRATAETAVLTPDVQTSEERKGLVGKWILQDCLYDPGAGYYKLLLDFRADGSQETKMLTYGDKKCAVQISYHYENAKFKAEAKEDKGLYHTIYEGILQSQPVFSDAKRFKKGEQIGTRYHFKVEGDELELSVEGLFFYTRKRKSPIGYQAVKDLGVRVPYIATYSAVL